MGRFILKRLCYSLLSIIGAVTIVFVVVRLSGDPVRLMLPPAATEEQVEVMRENLGFTDPVALQYVNYLKQISSGNFGDSLYFKESSLKLVIERLPATLELAFAAVIVAAAAGIAMGAASAVRKDTWVDYAVSSMAFTLQSLPVFFIGIVLILLFAIKLNWLPTSGNYGISSFILPVITLAAYPIAPIARTTRTALIEVLNENYMLTYRAQGFGIWKIVIKRCLKNVLIPVITVIALEMSAMIGGAVVTESIFSWPGLGQLIVQAVTARDFPLVQTCVIVLSLLYTGINFLADMIYFALDPRIKY